MKITKLTQSSKKEDRAVIHLENGEVFSVHKDLVLEKQLWADKDIEESLILEIKQSDLFYKLFDAALRKLSRRLYSEKEIVLSLNEYIYKKKLEVGESIKNDVLNKLKTYGFLDDEKFAQQFIETKSRSKSIYEIKQLLKLKGISQNIIDQLVNEEDGEGETKIIEKLAAKKLKSLLFKNLSPRELKLKTLNYLYRKGFPFDKSQQIVESLINSL